MVEYYAVVKWVHVCSAALSGGLFLVRGIWMLNSPRLLQLRAVRITPHVVDTVLLASAIVLMWLSAQYPFAQGWLTAKLLALILYIGLGSIALKYGSDRRIRLTAWLLAMAVFAYIVSVAITKQGLPL